MNRMMTRDGSVAATRMRTEQSINQPVMSARHNYKPHWRMVFIVYIFLLMQIFCMYVYDYERCTYYRHKKDIKKKR